jgi:prolyl-tRNA synthetase
MLQSKLFYKTSKDKSQDTEAASHDLLTRGGFVDQLMAGVYTFLPLGFMVLKNIEEIIRRNMEEAGGQEMLMPALNPKENWVKTGRWDTVDILFKLKGTGDKDYTLAPTHEEVVVPTVKKFIQSYRDLPFSVFHIQNKFRDELRAKSGILRTREFMMKDMYSFHANQEDLDIYYEKLVKTYLNIFKETGIGESTYRTFASGGSFAKYSDEFQTVTDAGEDIIYVCNKCNVAINREIKGETPNCPNCHPTGDLPEGDGASEFTEKKAVEVGNIFKLGTRFSEPFDLKFKDSDGEEKLVLMGCYGIGLGRLLGTIVEANHDDKGIIWPKSVAPFMVHLIQLGSDEKVKDTALKIYQELQKDNIKVLYDDREDKSAGEKFAESDLIGIPFRVIVSPKTISEDSVELKERANTESNLIKIKDLQKFINNV